MEFAENDDKFKIFRILHVKYAAFLCGVFGICATVGVFSFGIAIFPWSIYENAVNATAMTAFACFLISGCTVNFLILHGLQQVRFRFMVPSIIYHAFLMCLNGITSLIAVGELVSEGNLSARDEAMAKIVLCTCPSIFGLQAVMIYVIARTRTFVQCKRRHIRNGLPPPVREVIIISNSGNKISSSMELSIDSFVLSDTMMAYTTNERDA